MSTRETTRQRRLPSLKELTHEQLLEKCAHLEEESVSLRENIELLDELRSRMGHLSERLAMVNKISQELNTLDIDKLGEIAVRQISHLIQAKYCSLFLYDYQNDELVLKNHNHPAEITQRIAIKHHKNTIMGLALQRKKTVHIVNVAEYEQAHSLKLERTFADKYATQTCISIPLMSGNLPVGILNFADKLDGTHFDEMNDIPVVEQLGQVLAMALRNCSLFQEVQNQAKTDGMTRLANYRAFHEQLRREMHRAIRYNRPLTLMMLDIDHFKEVNDTYGHPGGDYALTELGNIIRNSVRREDLAARYGGDEVAVILPETTLSGTLILAGRILAVIRGHQFVFQGKSMKITTSIGIASFVPAMTITDFVSAVDSALYEAKQKGRDRYEVAKIKEN